ncbi:energy transducer TonB [Parabacteroides sp. FAFU027]|uniref:energy transducer TonB n=1 Tax=Parabacteroides sp. FAFU027 TaxID=2922715 RepID=UPI001FAFEA5F|nr:energy transducer TonB [Parabacteroides sp. FAFU027]
MAPKININSEEWVDMVFEGKNQAYGAPDLRKSSAKRLLKAFAIAVTLFLLGICTPVFLKYITPKKKISDESIRELSMIKLDKPKKSADVPRAITSPPPAAVQMRSSIKFVPPVIKPDEEVNEKEEFATQQEVISSKAAVGVVTYKGSEDINAPIPKSTEEAEASSSQITEEAQEAFIVVEQMPEFPGGTEELQKYLNNNIRYPVSALENGVQGRVICEFVVNSDGRVTNAKVIRGVDASLDAEALRVINNMPPWKPGKQRGKPVKVRYTLPVNFKLQN